MQRKRVAVATWGAWAATLVLALTLVPATKALAATGQDRILLSAAGWHGRAIQAPHQHSTTLTTANRQLKGWSAGPVTLGTGLHRPDGSNRVRELQRRLRRLGYRPGKIDGIYGPRTRAAMAWFKRKHGFQATGAATLAAVAHLRARTTGKHAAKDSHASAPKPSVTAESPRTLPRPQRAAATNSFEWWPWLVAALAVAAAAGAVVARQQPRPAPAPPPQRRPPRALGYIRVAAEDDDEATFDACATAIEKECATRGLALEALVSDELDDRRSHQRPGLNYALERLEADKLDCLAVGRIEQLAERQVDLHDVLARISRRGAVLVVLNVGPHLLHSSRRSTAQRPRKATERSEAGRDMLVKEHARDP